MQLLPSSDDVGEVSFMTKQTVLYPNPIRRFPNGVRGKAFGKFALEEAKKTAAFFGQRGITPLLDKARLIWAPEGL